MKNLYIQPETLAFPPPISNRGPAHGCAFHLYPPCMCLPSPALASRIPRPGRPSRGSRPAPCTTPARQHVRQPPSPHAPGQPRPLPDTGDAVQHPPFPVTGQNHSPQAEDGDLPSVPEQKFYGERRPGGGGRFSKGALLSRKSSPLRKNYSSASVSASPAASSEAGPARGASATERSGIRHCPGRGAVSSAFSPT